MPPFFKTKEQKRVTMWHCKRKEPKSQRHCTLLCNSLMVVTVKLRQPAAPLQRRNWKGIKSIGGSSTPHFCLIFVFSTEQRRTMIPAWWILRVFPFTTLLEVSYMHAFPLSQTTIHHWHFSTYVASAFKSASKKTLFSLVIKPLNFQLACLISIAHAA